MYCTEEAALDLIILITLSGSCYTTGEEILHKSVLGSLCGMFMKTYAGSCEL